MRPLHAALIKAFPHFQGWIDLQTEIFAPSQAHRYPVQAIAQHFIAMASRSPPPIHLLQLRVEPDPISIRRAELGSRKTKP